MKTISITRICFVNVTGDRQVYCSINNITKLVLKLDMGNETLRRALSEVVAQKNVAMKQS